MKRHKVTFSTTFYVDAKNRYDAIIKADKLFGYEIVNKDVQKGFVRVAREVPE